MGVAMRPYGSFAGKTTGYASLIALKDTIVSSPRIHNASVDGFTLDQISIVCPRLNPTRVDQ